MTSPDFSQNHVLSPLQKRILEIFKEVKIILDRHHLRYYALGGTCIGAVRHQGFIPWDDDLDIMMPDKDFYRFVEYARKELPPHLELILSYERPYCASLEAKVHDKRTTFIEDVEMRHPEVYKGIFIDIFRLSGAPEDERERTHFCKKFRIYKRLNEKRRLSIDLLPRLRSKMLWIAMLPFRLLPYRFWSDKIRRLTDRCPFDGHTYIARTWDIDIERLLVKREEVFGGAVELPFEDTTIACPGNYDKYLTDVFGDYMTLPPIEERQGPHTATSLIDVDKPYAYYQEQFRQHGAIKKDKV